jgi:hypothetical protein
MEPSVYIAGGKSYFSVADTELSSDCGLCCGLDSIAEAEGFLSAIFGCTIVHLK